MRLIRFGIISIVFLFLVITGISLFIPSHIRISKAINIAGERDSVMGQIKDPLKWKNWYPGVDSAKPFLVRGELKGMILDNTDSLHPVYLAITKIVDTEINARFVSRRMNPVENGWRSISYPGSDSIVLQWYMDFHLRWYPWEKFSSLLLERSYGQKMEQGLSNLKKITQH